MENKKYECVSVFVGMLVGISLTVVIYVVGIFDKVVDYFKDSSGNIQIVPVISLVTCVLTIIFGIITLCLNNINATKMQKKQISAELKSKARIKWAQEVREHSAGLILSYEQLRVSMFEYEYGDIRIQKYMTDFSSKCTLLKLYFASEKKNN